MSFLLGTGHNLIAWHQGSTTCVSGYVCTYQNDYYSQCLPGTATSSQATTTLVTSTTSKASTSSATATQTSAAGSFKWFGVDESGAEFGSSSYPGTWGIDFIFPSNTSLSVRSNHVFLTRREQC